MPRYDGDLIPNVTGFQLGEDDARWDGKLRNLDVSGNVTGNFSALAVNDIGHEVVPFSITPTFDATDNSGFEITLTGDVIASAITGLHAGMLVAFIIRQDSGGGWAFPWPVNVIGGMDIGTAPNEVSTQLFYATPTQLIAITTGNIA